MATQPWRSESCIKTPLMPAAIDRRARNSYGDPPTIRQRSRRGRGGSSFARARRMVVRIESAAITVSGWGSASGTSAGTRVRLYLNRTEHQGKPISCVDTLRRLLWVAAFHTDASDPQVTRKWSAGELCPPSDEVEVLPTHNPNVWWVSDQGVF